MLSPPHGHHPLSSEELKGAHKQLVNPPSYDSQARIRTHVFLKPTGAVLPKEATRAKVRWPQCRALYSQPDLPVPHGMLAPASSVLRGSQATVGSTPLRYSCLILRGKSWEQNLAQYSGAPIEYSSL